MSRLRWFIGLPVADRRQLIRTLFVVAFVRLALWVLPFRWLRALVARLVSPAPAGVEPADVRPGQRAQQVQRDLAWGIAARVSWAVERAGRFIPRSTCLVRALSAQALLAREGVASTLCFGVGGGNGQFRAHAWLECAGRVVVGGDEDLSRFAPLPQFSWSERVNVVRRGRSVST